VLLLIATLLATLTADLGPARVSYAKEIDLTGTVDCGQRSGRHCSLGDTLVPRTSDITGELAPAAIMISWIKDQLPSLDQDEDQRDNQGVPVPVGSPRLRVP